MKKSSFLALALAPMILGAPLAATAQSVSTDPVGFVKKDLPSGYTAVGVNMLKPAVYGAAVASSTASSITVADETAAIESLLGAGSYYVELTGGALVGDRIDIASASGNVITLDTAAAHNTLSDASAIPVNSTLVIREHHTIGDITALLGAANLHTGANYPDSSDQVYLYNNGFQLHAVFDGVWYDAGGNPADAKILAPGTGFLFYTNPDAPGRSLSLTVLGDVRNNDFVRPLAQGYQLVSTGFPVDVSPGALGMTPEFFTATSGEPENADQIYPYQGGFQLNYLFNDGRWYDAGGNDVTAANLFQAGGAVIMFRHTPDPDFRVANQVQ